MYFSESSVVRIYFATAGDRDQGANKCASNDFATRPSGLDVNGPRSTILTLIKKSG